jgi:hypothetical protein
MGANNALWFAKISLPGYKFSFQDAKPQYLIGQGNYGNNIKTILKTSIFSSFSIVQAKTKNSNSTRIPGL